MTKKIRTDIYKNIADYLVMFAGSAVYALAVVIFVRPSAIPLGGVTGISLILNYMFSLPVGTMIIILNVPLFIISFKSMGHRFLIRTIIVTICSAVLMDVFELFNITYTGDKILNVLYGGVMMGAGLGLILSRGATSGGSDILSKLINRKYQNMTIGNINLIINIVIIGIAAFIYKSPESALYAIVIQYVSSNVMDSVLSGIDNSCAALIITEIPEEISNVIMESMGRGVTAIPAKGMYTGDERTTLLCAVRSHEVKFLQRIVNSVDGASFIIVMNTREIIGQGFKMFGQ